MDPLGEQLRGAVAGPVVDDEDLVRRPGLGGQRVERPGEQLAPVAGDHHDRDATRRRRSLAGAGGAAGAGEREPLLLEVGGARAEFETGGDVAATGTAHLGPGFGASQHAQQPGGERFGRAVSGVDERSRLRAHRLRHATCRRRDDRDAQSPAPRG